MKHYFIQAEPNGSASFGGNEHLTATEAMQIVRYRDRKSFWGMAKKKGMPMRRINARVILIPRELFYRWLAKFDPIGCGR